MSIKNNIEKLLFESGFSGYRIAKESGVPQQTISRFITGESKLGNMKLDHADTLNEYYIKNKGEIEMTIAINKFKEIALAGSWELEGMRVITGLYNVDEVVEESALLYLEENEDETVSQFVLRKLEEEGRVKEADAYEEETDGIIWVDEIDKWIELE